MTKAKNRRKYAVIKAVQKAKQTEPKQEKETQVVNIPQVASNMFFSFNTSLGPPYHVLIDTNFIHFSIRNKIEIVQGMMDCLYAKCVPCVTDCILAELEKLGPRFKIALKVARDPRFERLPCSHSGTYADDCLIQRAMQHRCYIIATCDRGLKKRIRKIPGVPIMYVARHQYTIERMPEAYGAPL